MTDLRERIQKAQDQYKKKSFKNPSFKNTSFRISIELVAGVMVGVGLGYFIDTYFKTQPWGLVIGFFLGCGAGFYNIYRYSQKIKKDL